ncbi:MAG TPA: PilZ domain-containing protein [Bryobacteraceae bacterium]|nr:PilZ domain-containing protein [Bryobacteraceae bacterium]
MARKNKANTAGRLDRRQEQRHAVERPCRVAADALTSEGVSGVTLNVSRAGVLIRFPDSSVSCLLPKVGANARVVIDLPPSANYAPRSLECTGRVVRDMASRDDAPVLAFQIQRMEVRDTEPHPSAEKEGRKRLVH